MLEIEGVKKRFQDTEALKGVGFVLYEGEVFGLLGPNGAGKTTLIKIITGLIPPDEGRVTVDGFDVRSHWEEVKRLLGIVPQELSLYPGLSAEENLSLFGKLYGVSGRELKDRISFLLSLVGLWERREELVRNYSGGMKRRLNLALALIHSPNLLLLDEPTVGLDPQTRALVYDFILEVKEKGVSVLLTTHYIEEAERLCDRVAIIDEGKIIALASPGELIQRFAPEELIEVETEEELVLLKEKLLDAFASFSPLVVEKKVILKVRDGRRRLPRIMADLLSFGVSPTSIHFKEPNLEAVFLSFTGKELRD